MNNPLQNEDLRVFVTVARRGSFAAAAEELGMSPAYVSKRIGILESVLGVRLFQRTTRRVVITDDGEQVYVRAQGILDQLDELVDDVSERRREPSGQVRICSSFGFGRNLVAPVIAKLVAAYPGLQIRFEVFDRLVDTVAEGFDLDVRVGDEIAPQLIARRLRPNGRILCASPAYLARHGTPAAVTDLAGHRLLGFSAPASLNTWPLRHAQGEGYTVAPAVTASSGETVRHLALAGAGVASLSDFLTRADVAAGRLVPVLEEATLPWTQPVWAVFYKQGSLAPRVAALVDFLAQRLQDVLDR